MEDKPKSKYQKLFSILTTIGVMALLVIPGVICALLILYISIWHIFNGIYRPFVWAFLACGSGIIFLMWKFVRYDVL